MLQRRAESALLQQQGVAGEQCGCQQRRQLWGVHQQSGQSCGEAETVQSLQQNDERHAPMRIPLPQQQQRPLQRQSESTDCCEARCAAATVRRKQQHARERPLVPLRECEKEASQRLSHEEATGGALWQPQQQADAKHSG